jgi:hypothetical protein
METLLHLWPPVRLTLELAAISTLTLLVLATPLAWWLARSKRAWKEVIATIVSLPLVLPPTVLGFYMLIALGPDGPGGTIASLWGARTLAFTFQGLVIGCIVSALPVVVQPIRNAFAAVGDRPLEAAATLRASPWKAFWKVALPLASIGSGVGVLKHRWQFRRGPDDWRQYPGPYARHVDCHLRLCRDHAMARGQHSRGRDGGLRLRRDPVDDPPPEALRDGRGMMAKAPAGDFT